MTRWVYPKGSASQGDWEVSLGAQDSQTVPGWQYSGLQVARLNQGEQVSLPAGAWERMVVPLSGSYDVTSPRGTYHLRGRHDVFSSPTDTVYIGCDSPLTIRAVQAGRVAVASAPATTHFPDQLVPARNVDVALRGNGPISREARNFGMMDNIQAERLLVCEVITPSGSWSSYPVHKHDQAGPDETALEEIYYFDMQPLPGAPEGVKPFGYQGASASDDRPLDILTQIQPGDTVLIPYGWHGPSIAAPGFDLYYLNVMAGGGERDWKVTIDPGQNWIYQAVEAVPLDPRLPMEGQK